MAAHPSLLMTVTNKPDPAPLAAFESKLTVRELNSFVDAEAFKAPWNSLGLRSGADIYQTFDWSRLWWEHYGVGRKLHLLLYFRDGELVGVVPGFLETLWL